jgi:hypothetical protein
MTRSCVRGGGVSTAAGSLPLRGKGPAALSLFQKRLGKVIVDKSSDLARFYQHQSFEQLAFRTNKVQDHTFEGTKFNISCIHHVTQRVSYPSYCVQG